MAQLVVLSFVILLLILEVVIAFEEYHNRDENSEMDFFIFKRRHDLCNQPAKAGKCLHGVKFWHYNYVTKKCERSIYTLCGGNANWFYTQEECMNYCTNYKYVIDLAPDQENIEFMYE